MILDDEMQDSAALPVQLSPPESHPLRRLPEMQLLLAVLSDAIRTYERCAAARGAEQRREREDIERWFASSDADSPFSFLRICDTFDLDPGSVRRGLSRRLGTLAKRRPLASRG